MPTTIFNAAAISGVMLLAPLAWKAGLGCAIAINFAGAP
jgi:hypothetical protein